jgi:hypothetical protein
VRKSPGVPQGEALATWGLWALVVLAILVTYSRLGPDETYHVSRDGIVGGLSRVVVELNFPIALVAIGIALVALSALPASAWWAGGPAIALCAVTAVPGVVDQADLDARWINAVPAVGAATALALTVLAARRAGRGLAPPLSLDRVRIVLFVLTLLVSIPWIAAIVGFFLPEGIFIVERPGIEDGVTIAAVHLGQHHGFMGALMLASALVLSRPRLPAGRLAWVTRLADSLTLAYGAVNMIQDAWNEQLWKRGTVDWKIPSAIEPGPDPIWLVTLGLTALTALALRAEGRRLYAPGADGVSREASESA